MKSRDTIISFAREAMGLSKEAPIELSSLTKRGSDRQYFRLRWGAESSAIIVHYRPQRTENRYFAEIAHFLWKQGIPVPQIIRHDDARGLIVMQDLGDTDLWSLRSAPWHVRKSLYQKTLAVAHQLHSCDVTPVHSGGLRLMDAFTPDLYLWERDYFRENFVGGFCKIRLAQDTERQLENELALLAHRLLSYGHQPIHRDLQSQNVMICDGEPFLIDFQGMRLGSIFYDLGSILCDPYVTFSESERLELLSFYYDVSSPDQSRADYQKMFWEAAAQRLMQALGAYGHLGLQRGLRNYLAYIPGGLQNLCLAAERAASIPLLLEIGSLCSEALKQMESEWREINPQTGV
jgi:aminoglycoside/choline kinase family phosphotransferase